ncbi:hypothetical protein [Marinibactrum halimedae]|uniref:Cupin domain-containing protein n=1 Tax=Marinibactrum halimedae TaxID=1444977 RepID=A0AA37WL99_9GAMM|nr:hypothetical protein [Marinibactrum halimedae]MCD9459688.1 hypothetical protein [Marinibactrum halimedae]GLS25714.1 hypothetical protein GCM10007877_14280 [Marinibactrum halimedae]
MKVTTIYADAEGESHFGEKDFPLTESSPLGMMSVLQPATGVIFRETGADYNYEFHTAPREQFMVILEGGVDFTVSSGETRRFGPGGIVLLQDTVGKGHRSEAVEGKPRKSIFIPVVNEK